MKSSFPILAAACFSLVSCEKEQVTEVPVSTTPETVETAPVPAAIPVNEDAFKIGEEEPAENAPSPTPGQRLDHAIEKTEQGLGTAAEKTEGGLRKAAEKTGQFLQRAGEKIEKAGE